MIQAASDQRLMGVLTQAFGMLGLNVSTSTLQSLAMMIDQAMSGEGRYYHTTDHALGLTSRGNPIQSIAALFHDLVYLPVDHGFPPAVWSTVAPYLFQHGPGKVDFRLVDESPRNDISYRLVKEIFAFSDGHVLLTNGGTNEFLSALVMAKKLEGILPPVNLLQVVAYIQATIPFRHREQTGDGPFEDLAYRLEKISQDYQIPLSQAEIESTIKAAVLFANQDVGNFYSPDPAVFLENTWKLLPEINPALRRGSVYSLRDYRQALQAMEAFIHSINADDVLHEYKGVPAEVEFQEKLLNVRNNLAIGYEYLAIKLLTVAILEALAEITGGDGPISSFIGDVNENGNAFKGWESSLPGLDMKKPETDHHRLLYHLLETGRRGPLDFTDVKMSAISMLVYKYSGQGKYHTYLDSAKEMFAGKIKPVEFISSLDGSMFTAVKDAVAQMSSDMRERLMAVRLDTLE